MQTVSVHRCRHASRVSAEAFADTRVPVDSGSPSPGIAAFTPAASNSPGAAARDQTPAAKPSEAPQGVMRGRRLPTLLPSQVRRVRSQVEEMFPLTPSGQQGSPFPRTWFRMFPNQLFQVQET